MKIFFDTSVFVPLALGYHQHHSASQTAFLGLGRNRGYCAAHTLAEVYSTLTRMPPSDRLLPDQALVFVEQLTKSLEIVALEAAEYLQTVTELAAAGIVGGAIYDGLIARCALRVKADIIYTWNTRHFQRFGPEIEKRLRLPGT